MLCDPFVSVLSARVSWHTALLQQVMNLTPSQIELLPEQQKQQVLTLQKQMVIISSLQLCYEALSVLHLTSSILTFLCIPSAWPLKLKAGGACLYFTFPALLQRDHRRSYASQTLWAGHLQSKQDRPSYHLLQPVRHE